MFKSKHIRPKSNLRHVIVGAVLKSTKYLLRSMGWHIRYNMDTYHMMHMSLSHEGP